MRQILYVEEERREGGWRVKSAFKNKKGGCHICLDLESVTRDTFEKETFAFYFGLLAPKKYKKLAPNSIIIRTSQVLGRI